MFRWIKSLTWSSAVAEVLGAVEAKDKEQVIAKKYGWKRDLPDIRDQQYRYIGALTLADCLDIPDKVDLRHECPAVYDQGHLGSCTAQAIAGAYQFDEMKENLLAMLPSRLFIYYNERLMEGHVDTDSGASIRDGFKTLVKDGVCDEELWPYMIEKFSQKPPTKCYKAAEKHHALAYRRVKDNDLSDIQHALINGLPVVFGISVYQSFESEEAAQTGIIPMPNPEERLLGGHAVMAVGYDQTRRVLIMRNSWGTTWGDNGYFYLPYAYVQDSNLSADFWVLQRVD